MIIDLILDRKDGTNRVVRDGKLYTTPEYDAKRFYDAVSEYEVIGWGIADALDGGTDEDVKNELCKYIDEGEYNPEIKNYIKSVRWI